MTDGRAGRGSASSWPLYVRFVLCTPCIAEDYASFQTTPQPSQKPSSYKCDQHSGLLSYFLPAHSTHNSSGPCRARKPKQYEDMLIFAQLPGHQASDDEDSRLTKMATIDSSRYNLEPSLTARSACPIVLRV